MPKKVLLIEYEPRYVERVRTLVTPLGHTVVEARDGEAGLQAFSSSKFDLVLLSGMLPRLPSAEVIREIRKKGGATAPPIVLMMTGYRGSNRKADAQKVGAFDILVRPFSDEDFLASIGEALDSTDLGARTMGIDTSALATPALTSSDIFSDVLEGLIADAASHSGGASPESPRKPEIDVEKRLRDTLSGLMRPAGGGRPAPPSEGTPPPPAPATPSRARFSSDTDVERIIADTLSGLTVPKSKAPSTLTSPPAAVSGSPRRREEPAAAVPSSGPDRFGQYELLERIASGGMAELYRAKRTGVEGFQKIVAIKKILPHLADDEGFIGMFADEAKLAAQLNHPNVIHIYDLGKIQAGGYFIAMEYVDGRDLRAIEQAGQDLGLPMPVPLAVYIASKVASALDYAHRRLDAEGTELNIVHRDVSPQNILISYEGDIKLCDFGIAKAASKASKTQSGALKGKIQYMSPEQAWGKPIDRRSDLFSLGTVLHELLTGKRLFLGDTDINVLERVRSADVLPPSRSNPEVSHNLDTVVLKALAREPEDRYSNASDLQRDLDSVLYSYTPAPGSADVAIYLHRLQAEEGALAGRKAREAAPTSREPEAPLRRKSKGAPVSRRAGGGAPLPPERPGPRPSTDPQRPAKGPAHPPDEVFGSVEAKSAQVEKANRLPLTLGIAAAAVALAGFVVWRLMTPQAVPPPVRVRVRTVISTPAAMLEPTAAAPAALAPTAAPPPLDAKAIEAEVQRQLGLKRRELEKIAAEERKAQEEAQIPAPAVPPTSEPVFVAPTAVPTAVPAVRAEPTSAPAEPLAVEVEVQRGDMVGPGPGVVEPVLVSSPRVVYPPLERQLGVVGRVVVLVLVDETGKVREARLQQGIGKHAPLNDAVVASLRSAKFRAATKNGIPVKMWRPVIVEVKP